MQPRLLPYHGSARSAGVLRQLRFLIPMLLETGTRWIDVRPPAPPHHYYQCLHLRNGGDRGRGGREHRGNYLHFVARGL